MILAHYSQSESHRTTLDQTTNDRCDAIFQRGQLLSVYYTDSSSSTPANYFYSALAPYFTIDTPMGQLPPRTLHTLFGNRFRRFMTVICYGDSHALLDCRNMVGYVPSIQVHQSRSRSYIWLAIHSRATLDYNKSPV